MHTGRAWALIAAASSWNACASSTGKPAEQPEATTAPASGAAQPAPAATIAIPHAAQPLPGVLTGGQPTEADLRAAKDAGYRTVISLLATEQSAAEAEQARGLGLRFVSIPIAGAADLTAENTRKLADAMDAPDARPLILHCASGNRVGALLALKAFQVDGVSREQALELGVKAGLAALKPAVETKLDSPALP